jgi:hypothetical protein
VLWLDLLTHGNVASLAVAGAILSSMTVHTADMSHSQAEQFTRAACGCDDLLLQAIEQVEASTGTKLLRKYKLLQVQYKGVDAETRYVLISMC